MTVYFAFEDMNIKVDRPSYLKKREYIEKFIGDNK